MDGDGARHADGDSACYGGGADNGSNTDGYVIQPADAVEWTASERQHVTSSQRRAEPPCSPSAESAGGRPRVHTIDVGDWIRENTLAAAAAAADADIGDQMYAQEAFTTLTVSREVQKQKDDMDTYIDNLVAFLKLRADVLRTRQVQYRTYFSIVQVLIFVGSAVIAFITGFRVMYAAYKAGAAASLAPAGNATQPPATTDALNGALAALAPAEVLAFDVTVFLLSASMGLMTTLATFRGWSKKADDMSTVYAKAQITLMAMADSQLQVKFATTPDEIQLLRTTFLTREFKMFLETVRSISDHISFHTLTKHLPAQYNNNVHFLKVDRKYQADLLHEYLSDEAHQHELMRQYAIPPAGLGDMRASPPHSPVASAATSPSPRAVRSRGTTARAALFRGQHIHH